MTPKATMIPVASLRAGDRIAGGTVTAIRTSKSRLTTYITVERSSGGAYEFPQATATRIARF